MLDQLWNYEAENLFVTFKHADFDLGFAPLRQVAVDRRVTSRDERLLENLDLLNGAWSRDMRRQLQQAGGQVQTLDRRVQVGHRSSV